MKVTQVYEFLNDVSRQFQGSDCVRAIDTVGLQALGDTVLSSASDTDKFLGVLVDRIGKTIVRTLDLDINYPNLMMENFEFGAVLQKISVDPMDATEAARWDIAGDEFSPTLFKVDIPSARQTLFDGIQTWNVDVTIPDKLLRTAFTSAEKMGSFLDAIISAMRDSMTLKINYVNRITLNTAIAIKVGEDKNVHHLLTEYGDVSLTDPEEAMRTPAFLKFMWKTMMDEIDYMGEPTTLYNYDGCVRATRRDNMHIFLNSQVETAYKAYLESDTFNMEEIKLPLYQKVLSWQGFVGQHNEGTSEDPEWVKNTMPDFQSATTICNEYNTEVGTINKDYIIGAFFDRMALGTTIYDVRTSTDRNNRDEYTNYTSKCDIGQFIDTDHENGVIFMLD